MHTRGRKTTLLFAYLEKWTTDTPGKLALVEYEGEKQWMYSQLFERVETLALCLLKEGIRAGDRVAVMMPICADAVALMYACLRIGAVFSPLPYNLSLSQLRQVVEDIQPRLFCYELMPEKGAHTALIQYLATNQNAIPRVIEHNGSASFSGGTAWSDWVSRSRIRKLSWKSRFFPAANQGNGTLHGGSPAFIFIDRQSDGTVQPILLCYENLLAQRELMDRELRVNRSTKTLALDIPGAMHMWIHAILIPLSLGASVVLHAQLLDEVGLKAVWKHGVSMLIQTRSQYREMLDSDEMDVHARTMLKWVLLVDAPPEPKWMRRMLRLGENPVAGWLLPEAGGFVCLSHHRRKRTELAIAVGEVTKEQLSIRGMMGPEGNAGLQVPEGHLGFVCVHPPQVFAGYAGNGSATREKISKEGICYTGYRGFIAPEKGALILYLVDESSEKLQQMQAKWRAEGLIHPVMEGYRRSLGDTRAG